MSVCSTTFGAVRLTEEDAVTFQKQVKNHKPSKAARESYSRGKKTAKQFAKRGYAVLKVG